MKGIAVSREERTMDVVSLPKASFDRALSYMIGSSCLGISGDRDLPPAGQRDRKGDLPGNEVRNRSLFVFVNRRSLTEI